MEDNWVAIFGMLCVFGFPLAALIVSRVLAHRERMEMIRHGIVPPLGKMNATRYGTSGQPQYGQVEQPAPDASRLLGKGIRLAFIGMAITIGLAFIGYHPAEGARAEQFDFGPWLLGGLIPLFIGLSQVTIAFLTDPQIFARFRSGLPPPSMPPPTGPGGPYYGTPGPPPGAAGTAPGPEQSYTYRPGGTQELRPPTPPPTRRP